MEPECSERIKSEIVCGVLMSAGEVNEQCHMTLRSRLRPTAEDPPRHSNANRTSPDSARPKCKHSTRTTTSLEKASTYIHIRPDNRQRNWKTESVNLQHHGRSIQITCIARYTSASNPTRTRQPAEAQPV